MQKTKLTKAAGLAAVLAVAVATNLPKASLAANATTADNATQSSLLSHPTASLNLGTLGVGVSVESDINSIFSISANVNDVAYNITKQKIDGNEYNHKINFLSAGLIANARPFTQNKWIHGITFSAGLYYVNKINKVTENNLEYENVVTGYYKVGSSKPFTYLPRYGSQQANSLNTAKATLNNVAPYIGVGYSVAPIAGNGFTLGANLGAMYLAKPKVTVTPGTVNYKELVDSQTGETKTHTKDLDSAATLKDKLSKGMVYPVASLTIGYRF